MAIPLDQFTRQLADSSLMSADEVAALIAGLPAEKKPQDGEQLARELVRRKKLTAYQAQQIYAGKGKSLVLGNYVILDKLGQGGMGLVLKAQHRRMERLVALKVLSPKVTKSPEMLRRFQREVKAAARLEHANIVTAYDADEAGGTHFLVMQFIDGTDLSSLVKKSGPLPVDQALDCILQAARGLQYAHEHGVVHRDIKPANLLLDRQGTVKILDMGLARLDTAGAEQDQLTGTGQIMGTVDYMAPEQAMDTKHADARADVYSLGVTLWYLLTGRPLYTGETAVEKLMAHQSKPIPSLRSGCPAASPRLEAVFARMAAKKPAERYQSMQALVADLEPCRSGKGEAPAVHTAIEEDSKFDEFLRGLASASRHGSSGGRQSPPSTRAAVVTKQTPGTDPEATQEWSRPQVETNRQTEQRLPRPKPAKAGTTSVRSAAFRRSKPTQSGTANWRDWRWLTAVGAGGLLLILLGIWVVIRDRDGKEVARVRLPEGGNVTQEPDAVAAKPQPPPGLPSKAADDRSVAGWVFANGGTVKVRQGNGEPQPIGKASDLPAADFFLATINLTGCQTFADNDLLRLTSLRQLTELKLTKSALTDEGLRHIGQIRSLRYLEVGYTQVTNAGMQYIEPLADLVSLNLAATKVTDAGWVHLRQMANMQWLVLADCRVTDDGVKSLLHMESLVLLNLCGTQVTDGVFEHVVAFRNLNVLSLPRTAVSDVGVAKLKGLDGLKELYLNYTRVTDACVPVIRSLSKLTRVGLNGCGLTEAGISELETALPNCVISADREVDRQVAEWVLSVGGKIEISGPWDLVPITSALQLPKGPCCLRTVDLAGSQRVTDKDLAKFATLKMLRDLDLTGTPITDESLEHLLKLTRLTQLSIGGTKITAPGISRLRTALPNCTIAANETDREVSR